MTTNMRHHSAFKGTDAVTAAIIGNQVLRKAGGREKMHATDGEDAGDQQPAGEPEPVDPAGDGQPANLESPAEDATQAGRDLQDEERVVDDGASQR